MALEGFLQEFGLADILQLIYFQRKTGLLYIEGKADKINLNFIDGNIVSLESQRRMESNRLGKILIKKKLITQKDLDTAIDMQKTEGIKTGSVFVKYELVSKEVLTEIIQAQIIETLVQTFTWKEGRYKFIPQEVSVDSDLPICLDTQHMLMDGLRIVDEWSVVEGKLDLNTIYKQISEPDPGEVDDVEKEVLSLIDEDTDVSTIINSSYSEDFETSKAIISLEEKGIIEPIMVQPLEKEETGAAKRLENIFYIAMIGISLVVLISMFKGSFDVFTVFKGMRISFNIERLKTDIDIYNAVNGLYPERLEVIAEKKDPWGRPYIYKLTEGGFTLFSAGPDGIKGTGDDVY